MFSRRLFLSLILVAIPASADLLQVAVSGTFGGGAPTTELTGSGATWSLTFDVDSQLSVDPTISNVPVSNPEYDLNGVAVSGFNFDIMFNDVPDDGDLTARISNSDFSSYIDFFFVGSQQLYSGTEILTGTFDTAGGTQVDDPDINLGNVGAGPIVITSLPAVPEPRANLLLATVLAGTALLFRRRRRSAASREESQG